MSDKGGSKLGDLLGILIAAIVVLGIVAYILQQVLVILLIGLAVVVGTALLFKIFFPSQLSEWVERKSLGEHYLPPHERQQFQRGKRRRKLSASEDAENVITFDRRADDAEERRKGERLNRELSDTVRRGQRRNKKPGGPFGSPPRSAG